MGARGRQSQSSLDYGIEAVKRPDPPETLDAEAAEEWRKVVNRMPPDWFPEETHAMLEQRSRHVIWMRKTAEELNAVSNAKNFDPAAFNFLSRLAASQTRTLLNLDTTMRLTQQSVHEKGKRKGAVKTAKAPWQEAAE